MSNEQSLNYMIKSISKVGYLGYILLATGISSCYLQQPLEAKANEVIMFFGNPGVGKSTLCNSIFQQPIFESGLSVFTGLTTAKQEHLYEGKLYIDTPGVDDVKKRTQAAKEIEEALKHNNNYKIVFVAKIDSGRIRNSDLATINLVCESIKTPFEYGIVFNQVSKYEMLLFEKAGITGRQIIEFLSDTLVKKPASIVILEEDEALKHASNKYLQGNDENRRKLLDFINKLTANKIEEKSIEKIDTRNLEERIKEIEETYNRKYQDAQDAINERRKGGDCIVI